MHALIGLATALACGESDDAGLAQPLAVGGAAGAGGAGKPAGGASVAGLCGHPVAPAGAACPTEGSCGGDGNYVSSFCAARGRWRCLPGRPFQLQELPLSEHLRRRDLREVLRLLALNAPARLGGKPSSPGGI